MGVAPIGVSYSAARGAHAVTQDLEDALCAYTGAPYAVAVTSCTMALLLAVAYQVQRARWLAMEADKLLDFITHPFNVEIPKRTYVGVPMSIIHAGARPTFRDETWRGSYQLKPLPVWDSARWFTSGMYRGVTQQGINRDCRGDFVCVSFHASKTLADSQGGAILHDSPEADAWLRRARFDGRREGVAPKDDDFDMLGYHAYLSPDVSARLLWKLASLPRHNEPLPNDEYPDLSKHKAFQ